MQISVSIDSDRTRNVQPPQILGAVGHPHYNEVSVLTNFVLTGFHCTCLHEIVSKASWLMYT